MIIKNPFYFVRHGQTDYNILEGKNKGDHPQDIPLNLTGRDQAHNIKPMIETLPIQTICASPMRRAQETKEIITRALERPVYNISELGECNAKVWQEMSTLGMYSPLPPLGDAREFMEKVKVGLNQALSLPGPVLIVAHGGIHWATCCLLRIDQHPWAIENCGVVYFSMDESGKWIAKKLSGPQNKI